MKKLLFDTNFIDNKQNEQIMLSIFDACKNLNSDFIFNGYGNYNTNERITDNVVLPNGNFSGIGKYVKKLVAPVVAMLNKNIPYFFPCGNIPNFMPETTPIITLIGADALNNYEYLHIANSIKNHKRRFQTDINRSDLIFVLNDNVKNELQKEYLFLNEPVVLNYASMIPDEFISEAPSGFIEKYFYIDLNNCNQMYLNQLLKSFIYSYMTKQNDIKLYLVGELNCASEELLINLSVARKVGAVKDYKNISLHDKAVLLKSALAALLISDELAIPITHLDAMSCGCPVITNPNDEIKKICADSVIYINPASDIDIVELINELSKNDNIRSEYVSKGLNRVKKYSWNDAAEIFIENINRFYEK